MSARLGASPRPGKARSTGATAQWQTCIHTDMQASAHAHQRAVRMLFVRATVDTHAPPP